MKCFKKEDAIKNILKHLPSKFALKLVQVVTDTK